MGESGRPTMPGSFFYSLSLLLLIFSTSDASGVNKNEARDIPQMSVSVWSDWISPNFAISLTLSSMPGADPDQLLGLPCGGALGHH